MRYFAFGSCRPSQYNSSADGALTAKRRAQHTVLMRENCVCDPFGDSKGAIPAPLVGELRP